MIYIAICDDEKHMSDKIKKRVSDFFQKKNIEPSVSQFTSGRELLEYGGVIDILFLDIRMSDMGIIVYYTQKEEKDLCKIFVCALVNTLTIILSLTPKSTGNQ